MDKQAMINRIRKATQEETAKEEARINVINALPDDLENVYLVIASGYRCEGSVIFEVSTREEVAAIVAKLPAVDMVKISDGFVSFVPASRMTSKEEERADILPIAPYTLGLDKVADYPVYAKVEWYSQIGDYLINVEVRVKDAPTWAKFEPAHERDGRGRIIRHAWRRWAGGFAHFDQVNYASGTHNTPGNTIIYWKSNMGWDQIYQGATK